MKVVYIYLAVVFGGAAVAILFLRYQEDGIVGIVGVVGFTLIIVASAKRQEKKKAEERNSATDGPAA